MVRLFQQQLTNLESGLKRLEDEKVRMELEVWALRQHISTVSLSTVLDLVHAAMLRAQWWARDMPASAQLRDLASRVLLTYPSVESNLAAVYQELRVLHLDCSHCVQAVKVCREGVPCWSRHVHPEGHLLDRGHDRQGHDEPPALEGSS